MAGFHLNFVLLDHVEELRELAKRREYTHQTQYDEGSFVFRHGKQQLILTDVDDMLVRLSYYKDRTSAVRARNLYKVSWEQFYATVVGILIIFFGGEEVPGEVAFEDSFFGSEGKGPNTVNDE